MQKETAAANEKVVPSRVFLTWDEIPAEMLCPGPKMGSCCPSNTASPPARALRLLAMLGLETVPNRRPAVARGPVISLAAPVTVCDALSGLDPPFLPVHEDWKPLCW